MLGLEPPFKGNTATSWGCSNERLALAQFQHLSRGLFDVHQCGFRVLDGIDKQGRPLSWIGASPDGLLLPANSSNAQISQSSAKIVVLQGVSMPLS